jgi:TonB family protein
MNLKPIIIFGFLTLISWAGKSFAQVKKDTAQIQRETPGKGWFVVYDEVPKFPGGLEKFQQFIQSNLKKVESAAGKRVIISFIVEKDGSLNNIKIARGINEEADQEALRVIKLSPKWQPATRAGKLIRVAYSVPVKFN